MNLEKIYSELLSNIGFPANEIRQNWMDLEKAYSKKSRHYHNLTHLKQMIESFEVYRNKLENPNEVLFSIFYHDIVYSSSRKDNELKSAELFEQYLAQDLSIDIVQKIKRWIIATQKHEATDELDLQFLLDIDLAILAASPERFDEYEQQIQQEYAWVDPDIYSIKRKEVLVHFYQTEPLYQTEYFQQNFERKAKQNLKRILNI